MGVHLEKTLKMELFFNTLLCLSASTFVYSQPIDFRNSRKDDGNWRNPFSFWQNKNFYTSPAPGKSDYLSYYVEEPKPITIKTKMGALSVPSKNSMTEEERNQFLPVMKALSRVMETEYIAPSDLNTLLVRTRDLIKNIPEGNTQRLPAFVKKFDDIKIFLPEDGDIVTYKNGVPYILTNLGSSPMANMNLMTNEERERFLPVIKNVIRVFEKSIIDENEINERIAQGESRQGLLPKQLNDMIVQTLNQNFRYDIDQSGRIITIN